MSHPLLPSSPILVKICGLSEPATLEVALTVGADLVGFVFYETSPRNVSLQQAAELSRQVRGQAQKVALVVNSDRAHLEAIVAHLAPDLWQCHGTETPADVARIKDWFGI